MAKRFNEILSMLRHEKGVSQREAAAALNISQALLSHYENGVREPGLAFLAMACDYYDVSADYILGRSSIRLPFCFDEDERDSVEDFLNVAVWLARSSIRLDKKTREIFGSYVAAAVYSLAGKDNNAFISSLILLRMAELAGKLNDMGLSVPDSINRRIEKELEKLRTV